MRNTPKWERNPVTREYSHIGRRVSAAKTNQTNKNPGQCDEKSREGWKHPPHTCPPPSMDSHHFPRICRGEVSPDLPWSWVWCSYTGVLSTRITRRKSRAVERQSWLIFVALQEGSWGCWGWTELLIPWQRGGIRQWWGEWERGGAGSVLFTAKSPSKACLLLLSAGAKCPVTAVLRSDYGYGLV